MEALLSFTTNEIAISGTAGEWIELSCLLKSGVGSYCCESIANPLPYDGNAIAVVVATSDASLVDVTIVDNSVISISGPLVSLKQLGHNAAEMQFASPEEHCHVDYAILPDVLTERSSLMVWSRLESRDKSKGSRL